MAHWPLLAGGVSFLSFDEERSSSCAGVTGMAYRLWFVSGTSRLLFSVVDRILRTAEVGVEAVLLKLNDIGA